jgi:CPA1 family monovalent cation:H+ antiporter
MQRLRTASAGVVVSRPIGPDDYGRLVAAIPTFGRLGDAERRMILGAGRLREVAAGTTVVTAGDRGDAAYAIVSGRAVAGTPAEGDAYRALSTMVEGDLFGEIAALTGSPRTANVVADADSTLVEIPGATLRALMSRAAISELVLPKLTERLARTTSADLPRLAGVDQAALRDLRKPRAGGEAPSRTFAEGEGVL